MSKPIRVGDLVQVIKPPTCGCVTESIGMTRTVVGFAERKLKCVGCGTLRIGTAAILDGPAPWDRWHITVDRLKRIPPLDELEGEKQKEDIREPA